MVVYPKEAQEQIDRLMTEYPYSRLTVKPVRYQGKTYMSVDSTDLNLIGTIYHMFLEINQDPVIRSM